MKISKLLSVFIISLIALFFSFSCCSAGSDSYTMNFLIPSSTPPLDYFNSTWNTTKISTGSTNSTSIKLPLEATGTYDFTVDWGDGNSSYVTAWDQANVTHTYASGGSYDLSISGTITGWRFNNVGDKLKLTDISNWGSLNLGNSNGYFFGCQNFNATATDALDLTGTTDMSYAFTTAYVFNYDISSWDVSNVTNMSYMFSDAFIFNQDISSWDVSNVTDMSTMFRSANAFNQDISLWNTSSVEDMRYMFYGADIFDQNIGSWNISSLSDATGMFSGVTLSTANYDSLLIGWAGQAPYIQSNVIFHGGNSQYSCDAVTARNTTLISTYSWTITDGGLYGVCDACSVTNISGVWEFNNCSNIPSLHAAVGDESVLEYNVSQDIYTFYEPFYMNSSTDTFYFNETVHLKSNVGANPGYFEWNGTVIIDSSLVLGWDTNTNSIDIIPDSNRGYLRANTGASGNITNSNISYLGGCTTNKSGLTLNGYTNQLIENNTFVNSYYGIHVRYSNFNLFNNNTFHDTAYGILIQNSDNNTILNSIGYLNNYVFYIDYSDNTTLYNCTMYENYYYGAMFSVSNGFNISHNKFYDNGEIGFGIATSSYGLVYNNTVYGNDYVGIHIQSSSHDNLIENNTVYGNGEYGIYVTVSSENTFKNNIVDDDNGAYYDYMFKTSSQNNTILMDTKASNNFSVDTSINSLIFLDGIDYIIGFSGVASVIQDNPPIGTESVNITVISGTIDWINVTAGLDATTDYSSYYSINDTEIEQQTTDGAGIANFTTNLLTGTYYINESTTAPQNEYIPPDPINLANTTGNFYVNFTWQAGSGNVTDSFNVSQNGTWVNGSLTAFNNSTIPPHGYSEIIVYAYNSSGTGTLSTGYVTDNVTLENNPINLTDINPSYSINEGETLSIDANYTDLDSDVGVFDDNSTEWNIDSNTGIVSWITSDGDDGVYYWYINVSDGYGSTDQYNFSVTVNDFITPATPGIPTITGNTTGNFWVNYTFAYGTNTTHLNVSQNGSWSNGTTDLFNNASVGAHGYSAIIVCGYNSTSDLTGPCANDNVTVPNNNPTLTGLPNSNTNEDTDVIGAFDLDDYYSDADGDSPTYQVQSNDQSANVTVTINGDNTVDYILATDWHGVANIVFNVSDGYTGTDTDAIILTVSSINDCPVLDPIGAINEHENETVIVDVDATDPDFDTLTYACNRTDLFTDFNTNGGITTWTTNYSSAGVYYVNFSVDDGNGCEDYEVVTITIIDIPLIINSYWNNVTGNSLSLSITPGDYVEFGVTTNRTSDYISWYKGSTFLENDTATSQGNLTHQFNSAGVYYINVHAEDAYDTTANTTFTVSVAYTCPTVIDFNPNTPYRTDNGSNATFNVTYSQIGDISWYIDGVFIKTDSSVNYSSYTNTTGIVGGPYNVTASINTGVCIVDQEWLWTVTEPYENNLPLSIFIMWTCVMMLGAFLGFTQTGIFGITTSLLSTLIAFMNSKMIINGSVVQYFGGVTSTDTIATGSRSIESLPLSYIFMFIAIVMTIVFLLQLKNEIMYQIEPDIGDVDYE